MHDSVPCPKCGRRYVWTGTRCCHNSCRFGSGKRPRRRRAKIAGVYPVEADGPVHLIELIVEGDVEGFDFGEVTQEESGTPKANWQVAYDEQVVGESSEKAQYVFFFHHLDLSKPLLTPAGALSLPMPKKMPARLRGIEYKAP